MKYSINIFFIFSLLFTLSCVGQNIYNTAEVQLKPPLKTNWAFQTDAVILNQRIVGNICYLNTLQGITALSLDDGKELWKYSYPAIPAIPSVVTFSERFASFLTYEFDATKKEGVSKLFLIDLSNGKELWTISPKATWFKPTPIISDKNIFILGGEPDDWEKPEKYFEMELDKAFLFSYVIAEGKEEWKSKVSDENSVLLSLEGNQLFLTYDFDIEDDIPQNKLLCYDAVNGKKLWDYNPSGMITKSSVGEIVMFNQQLYVLPIKGYSGIIAALDPKDGDEKWSKRTGVNDFFIMDNKIYAYAKNIKTKAFSFTNWICLNIDDGDNLFTKELSSGMDVGFILGSVFAKTPLGMLMRSVVGYGNLLGSVFGSSKGEVPKIIPSLSLFSGLFNQSVVNEKGLFSIYNNDKEYFLYITSNIDDDKKIEYKLPQNVKDVSMANGTTSTQAFMTYKGKVVAINIADGKEEWVKDFDTTPDVLSLGLIIRDTKMYLFTTRGIYQLVNE